MSEVILILSYIGSTGLTISILGTIFLLYKFNVSNTAWIYTVLAGIAFFLAGIMRVTLATFATLVEFSWATPLGLPGGFILILQAVYQYLHDRSKIKERVSTSNNTETSDVVRIQ